jgi:hypothetical protein
MQIEAMSKAPPKAHIAEYKNNLSITVDDFSPAVAFETQSRM